VSAILRFLIKDYDNAKDPGVRSRCGKLAGTVGIVGNLLLFCAKLIVGLLSHSVSVMADALNNLMDASSSIVTLIGFRLSEKPADKHHPFGHARIEYLSGMAVAVLILLVGFELGKSSVEKLLEPQPTLFGAALVIVMLLSVGIKLWMAAFNRQVGRHIGSATLTAAAADSRNDVVATLAVLAASVVGHLLHVDLDGWVGLAVAAFILYSGFVALKETADPLLGEAADEELTAAVAQRLRKCEQVLGLHDLIVHDYGPGRRFASVHVEMDRRMDVMLAHELIDDLERDFAEYDHIQMVIHYDPVVVNDPVVDATRIWVEEQVKGIDPQLHIHDFRMVEGKGHTNLIFDVVRPQELALSAQQLHEAIRETISTQRPECRVVLHVDENYVAAE
jgi:cation diffusion facilitator family transporter